MGLCARGQRPHFYARVMHAYVMASFSVCPRRAPRSTVGIYGERKTIAWCPCTSPSTLEMFGEKISASPGSSKEIYSGFTEEDDDDDNDDDDDDEDDTKIVKSRMSGFSRGKLEAGMNELGLCTARYESMMMMNMMTRKL